MSERTREAAAALAATDPAMASLIERFGTVDLVARFRRRVPSIAGDPFVALLRSIVGQQLSTTSAEAIFGRFVALGPAGTLTPAVVLAASDADPRRVGLSGRKVEYVRDLAARVEDARLDLPALRHLDDDEVIATIFAVRGLGRWSAELFLLFHLRRPDVFPAGDLVLRHGIRDLYALQQTPPEPEARHLAARWHPHRSLAAMYLWELVAQSRTS
ncbi:MAG TPA: DNA-3-methyladenine glycosylase 2 family protein [Solirubrobacterales bacterium]